MKHILPLLLTVTLLTGNSLTAQQSDQSFFDSLREWVTQIAQDLDAALNHSLKEYTDSADDLVAAQSAGYTDQAVEGLNTLPSVSSLAEELEVGDFICYFPDVTGRRSDEITNIGYANVPGIVTEISKDKQYASVGYFTSGESFDDPNTYTIQRVKISGDSKSYIVILNEAEINHRLEGHPNQNWGYLVAATQAHYDAGWFDVVGDEFTLDCRDSRWDVTLTVPSIDEPFFIGESARGAKVYLNAYTHGVEVWSGGLGGHVKLQRQ